MATVDDALRSMMRNLEEKSGRSVADWANLARSSGLEKHGQIVAWLKREHGLGHGYANMVAAEAREGLVLDGPVDDALSAVFSGDRAGHRPLYDLIEAYAMSLGEVEVAPKKANISLRRSKQFALVQPSTRTRMDLGLQLKGVAADGRLEASGSWSAMVSHRVRLESPDAFDDTVKAWLKAAWAAA